MRAILVADFPDRFVQERILPELRRRVDVVLVAKTRAASEMDLESYSPDVVLHMTEFGCHSSSALLSATCRRAGITVRALSRKKASWSFLPPPRPAEPKKETKKMESPQKTNGTPLRATIGDHLPPALREQLAPASKPTDSAPAKRDEHVVLELSTSAQATISALTQALGKHGAEAILEHARAMRELAKAISGMPAAVTHGGASSPIEPAKVDPSVALADKIVEVVTKFPGLSSAEIHVLVAGGAGGIGIKATKNAVHMALVNLAKTGKLDRAGTGGMSDPFRYSPAA